MKKAIALAVAMTAAAGANAAFDTAPFVQENALNNLIFSAWTTTDGLDYSVNVDLNLNALTDDLLGLRDFSAENRSWSIDLSPLGADLSTLQWTVFSNNAAGTGTGLEVYTTTSSQAIPGLPSFSGQYVEMIDFMTANQGPAFVTTGTEGQADFGAEVVSASFANQVGVAGLLGDSMAFVAYDQQTGVPTFLNTFTFDGSMLTLAPVSSEVPVPAAAWLFGSALVGLAGVARKRKA